MLPFIFDEISRATPWPRRPPVSVSAWRPKFLLIEADSFQPLWHPQLRFDALNSLLESIDVDASDHEGLDVGPPHRKPMPFVVEGYQVPDPKLRPTDLLPKGIEIRTPVRDSIEDCLASLKGLHERLQQASEPGGYLAAVLSGSR
jgi:hypothetical protein